MEELLIVLPIFFGCALICILIYLIIKRIATKGTEEFEQREF